MLSVGKLVIYNLLLLINYGLYQKSATVATSLMQNVLINMCEKFHYDWLRNDRALGKGKYDNNKNPRKKKKNSSSSSSSNDENCTICRFISFLPSV